MDMEFKNNLDKYYEFDKKFNDVKFSNDHIGYRQLNKALYELITLDQKKKVTILIESNKIDGKPKKFVQTKEMYELFKESVDNPDCDDEDYCEDEGDEHCICGCQIRKIFGIENKETGDTYIVGRECIKAFKISTIIYNCTFCGRCKKTKKDCKNCVGKREFKDASIQNIFNKWMEYSKKNKDDWSKRVRSVRDPTTGTEMYHLYKNRKEDIVEYILNPTGVRGIYRLNESKTTIKNGFIYASWEKMESTNCKKCNQCSLYFEYNKDTEDWKRTCKICYYKNKKINNSKITEKYIRGTLIEDDEEKKFTIMKTCKCSECDKKMEYNSLKITLIQGRKQLCNGCLKKGV